MSEITISRAVRLPDPLRVARYLGNPVYGPRLLFLSGGSALNETAVALKRYTRNSIHLITTFDSGGSSRALRLAFDMPAIGDLRSRLMALADETALGHPEVFALFTYRLDKGGARRALEAEFAEMVAGQHPLVTPIAKPMRRIIQGHLAVFDQHRPEDFDLRGASIGNLILAGGYLDQNAGLEPSLFLMSKLVGTQGIVSSVADVRLNLAARLLDGREIVGQHRLTGKESPAPDSPIDEMFLCYSPDDPSPRSIKMPKRNRRLVGSADLICYAPGSFYSSLLATLMPVGTGAAIAARQVPKVFVPSLGHDPEAAHLDVAARVRVLIQQLRRDAGADAPVSDLLNLVLLDPGDPTPDAAIARLGVTPVRTPLTRAPDRYDPQKLSEALLSLT